MGSARNESRRVYDLVNEQRPFCLSETFEYGNPTDGLPAAHLQLVLISVS